MRRSELRRKLLAGAILLHFLALGLSALPSSRFSAALYPYYGWYPRWTRQNQAWAMYQYPDRGSNAFDLVARFDDGREERPWGDPRELSSRRMYFLEALFYRDDEERFARRFLDVLRQRWPGSQRPRSIDVVRTSVEINDYARVPENGIFGKRQEQRIERRW
jgi:hypothetical protein